MEVGEIIHPRGDWCTTEGRLPLNRQNIAVTKSIAEVLGIKSEVRLVGYFFGINLSELWNS